MSNNRNAAEGPEVDEDGRSISEEHRNANQRTENNENIQEQQDLEARGNDHGEGEMAREEDNNALAEIEECKSNTAIIFNEIEVKTKLAYGYLMEDYEMIESKRDKFMVMSQKVHDVHFHDVIKLNVGGHIFQTNLDTLRKYPQSLLATMFAECFELVKGEDGAYFIDRDGEHFRHILNYLRSGEGPTSAISTSSKEEIKREATFYGLGGLVDLVLKEASGLSEATDKGDDEDCWEIRYEDDNEDSDLPLDIDQNKQSIDGHFNETKAILDAIKGKLEDGLANMHKSITSLEVSKGKYLEMTKKIEDIHISDVVKLDVGGCIFKSNKSTLQKDPECLFAQMFSGQVKLTQQQDGSYFIDRDGSHFRYILNYLRIGNLPSILSKEARKELLEEAQFYNLKGLVACIKSIKINVGDATFETTSETLMKYPHSKLARALTEEVDGIRNIDGTLYIDRQSKCFGSLLEVMEGESVTHKLEDDVVDEAKYFDVKCVEKYNAGIFPGSKILQYKPGYQKQLLQWLNDTLDVREPSISLAYLADQDGWDAADFHAKCDTVEPSLILLESCFGNIFGGFTRKSWLGNRYGEDSTCILFSLCGQHHDKPFILRGTENMSRCAAINCDPDLGPCFSGRSKMAADWTDVLVISGSPNQTVCRVNSFQDIVGFHVPEDLRNSNEFLAGNETFHLKNMEVFAVEREIKKIRKKFEKRTKNRTPDPFYGNIQLVNYCKTRNNSSQ